MSRVEGSYLALRAKYCRFVSPRKTETLGILTPYLKAVPLLYISCAMIQTSLHVCRVATPYVLVICVDVIISSHSHDVQSCAKRHHTLPCE